MRATLLGCLSIGLPLGAGLQTPASAAPAAPATAPAAGTPPLSHERHDRIVAEYLDGKWADLEADLGPSPPTAPKPAAGAAGAAGAAAAPGSPAADRADVEAIRRALAECRPPWWKQVAAGKKVTFRPVVWGRTLSATYDPAPKVGISINLSGAQPSVTLKWDAADMDNPAHAEHGFSKGELSDLGIWMNLGMADSWVAIPLQSQANLNEQGKLQLTRYLEFRGNVTGTYYGSPRARRWALWLGLAAYQEKYAKSQSVMARKAIGAMFVAEVIGHRSRYPSIKLPESLPEEGSEAKLAEHLRGWVEKHPLTLAEDESLRDAVKAFAAANGGANAANVRQNGKVTLANGTDVMLDAEADKSAAGKREEWLKVQVNAAGK